MSRTAFALPLALLVPLAALGAAVPGAGKSLEEFARSVGMKEGGWRISMKLTAAEVEALPGADPAVVAAAKARIESKMGKAEESNECAAVASDGIEMPGILLETGCSYSKTEAAGGRWVITSACRDPKIGWTASFEAQGTYAPGRATGRHQVDMSHNGVRVRATLETASRFIGGCPQVQLEPLVITPVTEGD